MKLNTEHALLVQVTASYSSIYTYELLREVFSLLNFSQKPMLKQRFNFTKNNELQCVVKNSWKRLLIRYGPCGIRVERALFKALPSTDTFASDRQKWWRHLNFQLNYSSLESFITSKIRTKFPPPVYLLSVKFAGAQNVLTREHMRWYTRKGHGYMRNSSWRCHLGKVGWGEQRMWCRIRGPI